MMLLLAATMAFALPLGVIAPPETMKAIASLALQSSQTRRAVGTISTYPDVGLGVVGT